MFKTCKYKHNNYFQLLYSTYRNHRHLKLRTGGSHARGHEFRSIRFFNVGLTSANGVRFLRNFVKIIIQVYRAMLANLVLTSFIFTILLKMIRFSPVVLHVLRGICLVMYECSTNCCVTSATVVVFLPKCIHISYSYEHMEQRKRIL